MRNALKISAGVVAGFALGYAFCKRQLDQSYQDISNSEIADLKAHYEKRLKQDIDLAMQEYESWLAKSEGEGPIPESAKVLAGAEQILVQEAATAIVDYTKYAKPKKNHVEEAKHAKKHPVLISADEFLNGEAGFTQDTLSWYSEDNILADAGDKIVDGEERFAMVGEGVLETLVPAENEEGAVYFRNEAIGMDVEIIRIRGSYKEVVGLGDEYPAS